MQGMACIGEDRYLLNCWKIHLQVIVAPGKSNGVILSLFYEILLVEWLSDRSGSD